MGFHYEKRLEDDLNRIRELMREMVAQVEAALKNAVHALITGNAQLANATILDDNPINRASRKIDKLCHGFIALHSPSAGHLRLLSAIIRANIEIERIGDYAVTICRESLLLSKPPQGTLARELEIMAHKSQHMLKQAVGAFHAGNAEMARDTMSMADQVEYAFDNVFARLVNESEKNPGKIKEFYALLAIFNMLERVSDQAKNICEETVFTVTGEAKPKKTYRVLFLDEDNSCQSQMAEAIARRAFPKTGRYSSGAGRRPAETLNPDLVRFLQKHSIDLSKAKPKAAPLDRETLADFHVIVSLQEPVKSYISEVPFHTVALVWDVGAAPAGMDADEQSYKEMYGEIAVQVNRLMETLGGSEQ
ncbi:MAG: phosphate signaling complex protein PhoU [Gammaproteobacteria bacterium]|nr:phosphate signaling complex protein PhoU [Gammaproteobacteria bacterium]